MMTSLDTTQTPRFTMTWDRGLRALVVTTTDKYLKKVAAIIAHLDQPMAQVHIEGKIVEVNEDDAKSLGITWSTTQTSGTQQVGGSAVLSQGNPFVAFYTNATALSFINAQIDALVTKNRANIISSPSVTTADNNPAEIQATDTDYIQVATVVQSASGPTTTFNYNPENIPLDLKVTPKISMEDNKVYANINFSLTTANSVVTNQQQPANTTQQLITTNLVIDSGDTAVIGGIFKDSYINDTSSVPILGDIPLLGLLFKGNTTTKTKDDIIIFITPTIVPN
jgi:type IV pilus assembly protein PilQ